MSEQPFDMNVKTIFWNAGTHKMFIAICCDVQMLSSDFCIFSIKFVLVTNCMSQVK